MLSDSQKRAILTAEPFPSGPVARSQQWSIDTRANVVEDPGMKPDLPTEMAILLVSIAGFHVTSLNFRLQNY